MERDLFRLITAVTITLATIAVVIVIMVSAFKGMRRLINYSSHPFTVEVGCPKGSYDASVTVKARGDHQGDLVILFEIIGRDGVTVCLEDGTEYCDWVIEKFSGKSLRHTYTVCGCPEGRNLLRVSITTGSRTHTYMKTFMAGKE